MFGDALKILMIQHGFKNATQFARATNINSTYISQILKMENENIMKKTKIKLAKALDLELIEFDIKIEKILSEMRNVRVDRLGD